MESTRVVELTTEIGQSDQEEESVLVAALAALLVDYERFTKKRNGHESSENWPSNWRLLSRWQQLRG